VAVARKDGFGRLAIAAAFSDHEGPESLVPLAVARGAKADRLVGTVYGVLSYPVSDETVRATIDQDEVVFVGSDAVLAGMKAVGVAQETGKTYVELPVVKINFGAAPVIMGEKLPTAPPPEAPPINAGMFNGSTPAAEAPAAETPAAETPAAETPAAAAPEANLLDD
jgi:hypothetical protein